MEASITVWKERVKIDEHEVNNAIMIDFSRCLQKEKNLLGWL